MERSWDSSLVREMLARTGEGGTIGGIDAFRPEHLPKHYGMQTDGMYKLSDDQAQEILQMRLQRLTGLEQDKIVNEYKDVMAEIADLLDILSKPERVTTIITDEMTHVVNEFGDPQKDPRRSNIEHNATDLGTEDLITPQDMVVDPVAHRLHEGAADHRVPRAQKRGGARQAGHGDQRGRLDRPAVHRQHRTTTSCASPTAAACTGSRCGKVPQGSRNSRGKPIVNMFPLADNEKITVILPLSGANPHLP